MPHLKHTLAQVAQPSGFSAASEALEAQSLERVIAWLWRPMILLGFVATVYGLVSAMSPFANGAAFIVASASTALAMAVVLTHLRFVSRRPSSAKSLGPLKHQYELLLRQHDALMSNDSVAIALTKGSVLQSTNPRFSHVFGVQVAGGGEATAIAAILRGFGFEANQNRMERLMVRVAARARRKGAVKLNLAYQLDRYEGSWLKLEARLADPSSASSSLLWIVADGTASKKANDQLQFLAQHDALTGLANRRQWMVRARQVLETQSAPEGQLDFGVELDPYSNLVRPVDRLRREGVIALISIAVDGLTAIHERHGLSNSEEALIVIARRLAHSVRSSDLVARIGDDQFVVLLRQVKDRSEAALLGAKLRDLLCSPIELNDIELQVTVSVGLALAPEDGIAIEPLLAHADQQMLASRRAMREHVMKNVQEGLALTY
jgi:diguanylate cyclase (GGDEF)-like protein